MSRRRDLKDDDKSKMSRSMSSLPSSNVTHFQQGVDTLRNAKKGEQKIHTLLQRAHRMYNAGQYKQALICCEDAYEIDAFRTDNLLLLGSIHFQLRNFSESIFYNQQCIRVDPSFAEAFSNLGNGLKELGDIQAAIQFYMKAIKLKPRFGDAYNNLASAYMQLGQLQEAMETYRMAIVLNPGLVDAHSNMGNLHKATGDLESAKRCYLEAIRIRPDFAIAWSNLAGVFKDEGQLKTAVAYYQEAIRLCPEFADAHSNLGNALKDSNELAEAISSYQTSIKLRPDFAIAHGNLGSCYYDKGDMAAAIRSFKYAIQLEPNFPDAYNNLGNAQREIGNLDEAILCYRAALRLKPDHPHAYNNLGNSMRDKGMVQEAIHCYVTAARLMPQFAASHNNLGSILREQGKLDQALAHYKEAVSIDPEFKDAYSNMGNVYKDLNCPVEAMEAYQKAISIDPKFADAHCNMGALHFDFGRVAEAIACYKLALLHRPNFPDAFASLVQAQRMVCNWDTYEEDIKKLHEITSNQLAAEAQNKSVLPAVQPFHTLIYPFSLEEMQQIARRYSAKTIMNSSLIDRSGVFLQKPISARVKVGYISSDFGNHPMGHLIQSVFAFHDRSKFEIYCYSLTPSDCSEWRVRIEQGVDAIKDISQMHFSDAVNQIRADRVHILINLNGYTKGSKNEIFALRPAPLQISLMGFCGTMGTPFMNYMIADPTVIPPVFREYYDEKIISMPHTFFVNDHRQSSRFILDNSKAVKRAQYGIDEDKFVFCCFNKLSKIEPELFDTWVRILKRVPNSVLWLLRFPPVGEENIFNEARKRGLRHDQIVFSDIVPKIEHQSRCVLADLCLDTTGYNSHTTSCDMLWAGTPLVTLPGDRMASRVAASMLTSCGLQELICPTLAAYEELAVSLAQDTDKLYSMRQHLERCRENCAAFDTPRWVRNMEKGLLAAWERHENGLSPGDILVPDIDPVFEVKEEELLGFSAPPPGGDDEDAYADDFGGV